jgi:hypothetical protein
VFGVRSDPAGWLSAFGSSPSLQHIGHDINQLPRRRQKPVTPLTRRKMIPGYQPNVSGLTEMAATNWGWSQNLLIRQALGTKSTDGVGLSPPSCLRMYPAGVCTCLSCSRFSQRTRHFLDHTLDARACWRGATARVLQLMADFSGWPRLGRLGR